MTHDVGRGERSVVGVHPQHTVGSGVGDVQYARVFVQNHVAGNAHDVAELNIGVSLNDAVGMVVLAGVVIGLEVVANQLAVEPVVVPVDVVNIVGDANPVRRFMQHIDVAAKEPVSCVLILPSEVTERGRPQSRAHEVVCVEPIVVGVP